jgi:hypothetical protein
MYDAACASQVSRPIAIRGTFRAMELFARLVQFLFFCFFLNIISSIPFLYVALIVSISAT